MGSIPARTPEQIAELVIVGGGVMGMFTAYEASRWTDAVVVLERGRVGDPTTASYGLTRSFRSDYLDPAYARLADEALRLWEDFEAREGVEVLVRCGCLNIAKASVTPDLESSYAARAHAVLEELGLRTEALDGAAVRSRHPWLDADLGRLAVDAGVVDLVAVREALQAALADRGVAVREEVAVAAIEWADGVYRVSTDAGEVLARSLVVCAGHGSNEVLELVPGTSLFVPLSRDRPSEAKYVFPPAGERARFTPDAMPVVAYLDTGIYCHPVLDGRVDAVKIGYYNPPDVPRQATSIDSVAAFVAECLPGLRDAEVRDVEDVDSCDYDLVADDEFVLGPIPGAPRAYLGVGWRGTGYKFAPWVGRVLAQLALQGATVYDVARFDPARFVAGAAR